MVDKQYYANYKVQQFKGKDRPFSFHNDLEITLTLNDGGYYFVGDRAYPIAWGHLFLFNNSDLHRSCFGESGETCSETTYRRYTLHFQPEILNGISSEPSILLGCFFERSADFSHCLPLSGQQTEWFIELMKRACDASEDDSKWSKPIFVTALAEMLIEINRNILKSSTGAAPEAAGEAFGRIKPVIEYLRSHQNENITLEALSEKFYIDKYNLCKLFKRETDFTVIEYLTHCRIITAQELLRKGYAISQVGEMVGFSSDASFIRAFKRITRCTPGQYRKNYIKDKRQTV